MKLIYCASINYPSPFANRVQTLSMSQAFSNILGKDFWLGSIDVSHQENIYNGQLINFFSLKSPILSFKQILFIKKNKIEVVFSREHKLLFFIMLYNWLFFHLNLKYIYESHGLFERPHFLENIVLYKCDRIITTTSFAKNGLEKLGVDPQKFYVLPNGVNLDLFKNVKSKNDCRLKLNLPLNKKIITYIGSIGLYDWKGIDIFLESRRFLDRGSNSIFLVVGGQPAEVEVARKKYSSEEIIFTGQQVRELIPSYLQASDVLVLPNKKGYKESEFYTSPIKLFEYMASGVPIIASDLPSIREILNKNNSVLIESDSMEKLALGINGILQDGELADRISKQAFFDVGGYTWNERARKVIEFIK